MEITGKVHCLFEQSGTFKNQFRALGYEAFDYDIDNLYSQTDNVIDLFKEIEQGYGGQPSIFDGIGQDDLIMAFFPCTYFSGIQTNFYMLSSYIKGKVRELDYAIERAKKRNEYHVLLYKLYGIALQRGLRLVIENPWSFQSYLTAAGNFPNPALIEQGQEHEG